jgi:methyl-accepting chemotaxis protein
LAEPTTDEGFEGAAARLERALTRLDTSVRTLNGRMRTHARIELDTQKLVNDRARLAGELDKVNARARRLDESAGEVSRRLVEAMETVRQVMLR